MRKQNTDCVCVQQGWQTDLAQTSRSSHTRLDRIRMLSQHSKSTNFCCNLDRSAHRHRCRSNRAAAQQAAPPNKTSRRPDPCRQRRNSESRFACCGVQCGLPLSLGVHNHSRSCRKTFRNQNVAKCKFLGF